VYWELVRCRGVEINRDKMKYTGIVCFVSKMQGTIEMRRELTGLTDIWHG